MFRFASIFYLVLAVGGVVWVGWREGAIAPRLFAEPESAGRDLALGLAGGGALLGVWELSRRRLAVCRRLEGELAEALGPMARSEAFGLALLSGFSEEVFFRGAVQGSLGWPLATALFALTHTARGRHSLFWTGFALVAGLVFAASTEVTGNLLAPVTAHTLVNAVNLERLRKMPPAGGLEGT